MISNIYLILIPLLILQFVSSSPVPEEIYNPELGPYFEGDIVLQPNQRAGTPWLTSRWPDRTLVYTIGPGFSAKEEKLILDGIKEIQNKTCVRFRKAWTQDRDYVVYTKASNNNCWSVYGRSGGRQIINLASSCFNSGYGTVIHETYHALGFYHEQARSDRDNYVIIHTNRIKPDKIDNFRKQPNSLLFGVPYDYGSIMHYSKRDFAKVAGQVTIETKQKGVSIGQRKGLSKYDIMKLNRMYVRMLNNFFSL